MHARQTAMPLLVGSGYQPVLNGDALSLTPQRRHFHRVDAVSPGVPLRQRRLIESVGELHLVEIAAGQTPHLPERRFYLAEHCFGKNAR